MDYYVDELRDCSRPGKEASLAAGYQTLVENHDVDAKKNTTICDRSGKIIAWILPTIISDELQVSSPELLPSVVSSSSRNMCMSIPRF